MGISTILLTLSGFLLKEWDALSNVVTKHFFFARNKNQGIYEILDYETTLELSTSGKTATFLKRLKVKFLQDNTISFQDYIWGDNDTLSSYSCKPGKVVDWYQEGDRWNILISLLQTKSRGDIEEFFIQTKIKNGFTKREEWQQQEIRHKTRRLRMTVVLPKRRYCTQAIIKQRSTHKSTELGPEHFGEMADGRQVITWETKDIEPLEVFTLWWEWNQ